MANYNDMSTRIEKINPEEGIYGIAYSLVEQAYKKYFGEEFDSQKDISREINLQEAIKDIIFNIETTANTQGQKLTDPEVSKALRYAEAAIKAYHQSRTKQMRGQYVVDPSLAKMVEAHNKEALSPLISWSASEQKASASKTKAQIKKSPSGGKTKISTNRIVVFDTETTGFEDPHIVSLGYRIFENGEEVDSGVEYFDPEKDIAPDATEVHKITNARVANEKTFKEKISRIKKIIGGPNTILVGHNSSTAEKSFDEKVLASEFKRAGAEMPKHYSVDTLSISRALWRGKGNRLASVAERLKLPIATAGNEQENFHDAYFDTKVTSEILFEFAKMAESNPQLAELLIPQRQLEDGTWVRADANRISLQDFGNFEITQSSAIESVTSTQASDAVIKTIASIKNSQAQSSIKTNQYIVENVKKLGRDVSSLVHSSDSEAEEKRKIIQAYGQVGVGVSFEGNRAYFYSLEKYGNDINRAKKENEVAEIVFGALSDDGTTIMRGNVASPNLMHLTQDFISPNAPPELALVTSNEMQYRKLNAIRGFEQDGKFIQSILTGDYKKASNIGNMVIKDVLEGNPTAISKAAAEEIRGDLHGKKTEEQMAAVYGMYTAKELLEETFRYNIEEIQNFYNRKGIKKNLEKYNIGSNEMIALQEAYSILAMGAENYITPEKGTLLDYILNGDQSIEIDDNLPDNEYKKMKRLRDPFVAFRNMAKQAGRAGLLPSLESLKEQAVISGFSSISGAHDIIPLNMLGDFSNRSLNQIFNYLERVNNTPSEISSPFIYTSAIGRDIGVDYSKRELYQYEGARTSDTEIAEALIKIINDTTQYSRALREEAKRMQATASVEEGGMLISADMAKDLTAYREEVLNLGEGVSDKFLEEYFAASKDEIIEQIKDGELIEINKKLDKKTNVAKGVNLSFGDIIVGLKKTGDELKLITKRQQKVRTGTKLLGETGGRHTAHIISKDLMTAISSQLRLKNNHNIKFLIEKSKLSSKKLMEPLRGRLSYIIQEAMRGKNGKSLEEIVKILQETTQLGKSFSIVDGKLQSSAFYNQETGRYQYIDSEGLKDLFEGSTEEEYQRNVTLGLDETRKGSDLEKFGRAVLGNTRYERTLGHIMQFVNQANETPYFEAVGSGSPTLIEEEGRVKVDDKERRASARVLQEQIQSIRDNEEISEEEKSELLKGIELVQKAEEKALNTFGKKGLKAQGQREALNMAIKRTKGEISQSMEPRIDINFDKDGNAILKKYNPSTHEEETKIIAASDYLSAMPERRAGGTISKEEYDKTLMAQIRDFAQAGENLILHIDGTLINLADLGEIEYRDGAIMPSQTDKINMGAFASVLKGQDKKEIRDTIIEGYDKAANDKESGIYQSAVKSYLPNSSYLQAVGINREYSAQGTSNIARISSSKMKSMLRSQKGAESSDIKENIKNLSYLLKYANGTEIDIGQINEMTAKQLIALENQIVNEIIKAIKDGFILTGQHHRYPSTSGRDLRYAGFTIDDTLEDNAIALTRGQALTVNEDYDGDKSYIRFMLGNYSSYEDFALAQKAQEKLRSVEDIVTQLMQQREDRKRAQEIEDLRRLSELQSKSDDSSNLTEEEQEELKLLEDSYYSGFISDMSNRKANEVASLLAKMNFSQIGYFSNMHTRVRNFMTDSNFESEGNDIEANIIRAFMETLEQDAISSKKVFQRLQKGGDNATAAIEDLRKLGNFVREGNIVEALNLAENLGIDFTSGRQFALMESTLRALGGNIWKRYSEQIGEESFDDNSKIKKESNEKRKERAKAMLIEAFRKIGIKAEESGNTLKGVLLGYTDNGGRPNRQRRNILTSAQNKVSLTGDVISSEQKKTATNGQFTVKLIPFDYLADKHKYIAKDTGEEMLSSTQVASRVLAKSSPELARAAGDMNNLLQSRIDKQNDEIITAEELGARQETFNFLSNFVGSGLRGDLFHASIDTLTDLGFDSMQALEEAAKELDASDEIKQAYIRMQDMIQQTQKKIKLLGLDDDYLQNNQDIQEYMDYMFPKDLQGKRNMKKPILSEQQYAIRFTDSNGKHYDVGLTPDQMWMMQKTNGEAQGRITDNKRKGKITGEAETIQLSLQKLLGELLYPELFKNAQASIILVNDKGAAEIPFDTLSTNDLGTLVRMAYSEEALSEEQKKKINLMHTTGIQSSSEKFWEPSSKRGFQNILRNYKSSNKAAFNQEVEVARAEKKMENYSGNSELEKRALAENVKKQKEILYILQQQQYFLTEKGVSYYDENGILHEIKLSEEQINQLKKEGATLELQKEKNMAKVNATIKEQKSLFDQLADGLKRSLTNLVDYSLAGMAVGWIRDSFTQAIQYTKELDAALTNLQIAAGTTREETKVMLRDYNSLAKELGRTTQEVATASNDWLRAGYLGEEASQLTKASMQLSTLGMTDAASATTNLISVMKGWKLEAEDVGNVVDKLTAIDMAAAISAGELAEGMAEGNNAARLAGASLDWYAGIIAATADATQMGASRVGNAFKTIFARYGNIKAGKFAATEEDMMSESYNADEFENLNDVAKVLGKVGISIQDGTNFKDIQDVITEIAERWKTFNEVEQNAISTALAGTRQREAFYTAMENWTKVTNLATISANSLGTAEEKMAAYSNSLEAAQNRVITAFEGWVLNIPIAEVLTTINNGLAFLIDNLHIIGTMLPIIFAARNKDGIAGLFQDLLGFGEDFFIQKGMQQSKGKSFSELKEDAEKNLEKRILSAFYIGEENNFSNFVKEKVKNKKISSDAEDIIIKGFSSIFEQEIAQKLIKEDIWLEWQNYGSNLFKTIDGQIDSSKLDTVEKQLIDLGMSAADAKEAIRMMSSEMDEETRKSIAERMEGAAAFTPDKIEGTKMIVAGLMNTAAPIIGTLGGTYLGGELGNLLGGSAGSTAGSIIGGIAGNLVPELGTTITTKLLPKLGSLGGSVGSIATKISSTLGSLAGPVGAIAASLFVGIPSIITAIQDFQKQEAQKKAVEEAAAAEESYKSAITSTSQVERYDELVKGVDSLGRNISLTDEEYQEFLDTSNALAAVFPELVSRTDEWGNSFLGANGKVQEITSSVKILTEEMQRAYNMSLINPDYAEIELKNAQKILEEAQGKISQSQYKINQIKQKEEQYLDFINKGETKSQDIYSLYESYGLDSTNIYQEGTVAIDVGSNNMIEELRNLLLDSGIMEYNNRNGNLDSYLFVSKWDEEKALDIVNEYLKNQKEEVEKDFKLYSEESKKNIAELDSNIKSGNKEIEKTKKALEPIVSAEVQNSIGVNEWNTYSEEQKQAMTTLASSVSLFNEDGSYKEWEEYEADIEERVKNLQTFMSDPANALVITTAFEDDSQKTAQEAEEAMKSFVLALIQSLPAGTSWDEINGLLLSYGFKYTGATDEEFNPNNIKVNDLEYEQSIRSKLITEKGFQLSYDQMGKIAIQDLEYAYENFDVNQIEKVGKSIDKFYDILHGEKLKTDNLAFFISEFDKLVDLGIKMDSNGNSDERYLYGLGEAILQYADVLGVALDEGTRFEEQLDAVIEKARQMPEIDLWGTTSLTPNEINEKYTNYQSYLDYLKNDYKGEWDAQFLGDMLEKNPELISYVGDIDSLKNKLTDFLSNAETEYNASLRGMLLNNEEWVSNLEENYNIDLDNFTSLKSAQFAIDQATTGDIEGAWDTWVDNMSEKYDIDLNNYTEKASIKLALAKRIAEEEGKVSYDEWYSNLSDTAKRRFGNNPELALKYFTEASGIDINSPDTWLDVEQLKATIDAISGAIAGNVGNIGNTGGSSSSSKSKDEGPTTEDILDALKGTVNKEYEAMLSYNSKTGKGIKNSEYYSKMRDVLNKQLNNYNAMLGSAENEQERLEALSKIRSTQVEIANLDDEQKKDAMTIAELQNMSLEGRIKLQKSMLATADTLEERLQMEQDLNNLIKERENLISAEGDLINKEYRDLLDFNGQKGNGNQYYIDRKANLEELLAFYEDFLKRSYLSEEDRLAYEKKIQDVKLEIANLDDEELEARLDLLQTQEATLQTQIKVQKNLIQASDSISEQVERQKELNELLKEEYELRNSFNNFKIEEIQREMDRTNPESKEYADLVNQQVELAQNSADMALEEIKRKASELKIQYSSEGYSGEELNNLVMSSEEIQSLYQNYLENIDKKVQVMLDYVDARIEKIDFEINQMEISKPQEWSSIDQIISYSEKNIELLEKKIPILKEALKNSANMTNEQIQNYVNQLNQAYKAIHDAQIQQQQDIVNYQEEVYSALTWQVQQYIDQINDQKEVIEDYYDTEIDKLNKVNEAKERTIELEKLQDALLNARQEKQRVYREGVGWVYEADRSKIKEAEQNLEDFYLNDKITDLNNTKEQELEALNQRIENWNKYLEALQDAHDKYENEMKEQLLLELLNVKNQDELYDKINGDMENYITEYDKNVTDYGTTTTKYAGIFSDFLLEYEESVTKLDELQKKVIAIFDGLITGAGIDSDESLSGIIEDVKIDWSAVWWKAQKDFEAGLITEEKKNAMQEWAHANKAEEMEGSGATFNPGNGTWTGGNSSGGSSSDNKGSGSSGGNKGNGSSSGGNKYQGSSSSGGADYVIGSDKGQNFIDNAKPGQSMTGGDGSIWKKNPDGSTTIVRGDETWTVPGYAKGIENGPVTRTGLSMLHGSFSRPEYVLNNDQAWQLLRNFATTKIPERTNNINSSKNDVFNINGDIVLNDVKNPSEFWDKLMEATKNRFNITKRNR